MNLSKSKFCAGLQCPKILWMDNHMPDRFDSSVVNNSLTEDGNAVGDLAKGYFRADVIAGASFAWDGNFCSVDLLRRVSGGYELVDVKAYAVSEGSQTKNVKPLYIQDMAYQVYVLNKCGINIKKVSILQLNRNYIRQGELDIHRLFVMIDCTDLVFRRQKNIEKRVGKIRAIATGESEPIFQTGSRCNNPNECGYKNWCFRHLPHGSGKQQQQASAIAENLKPHINKKAIRDFLSTVRYPLYYLDFETFRQPVPLWDNLSPYTQIPFQYSVHIQQEPCGEAMHKEFLGKECVDPRRNLAERLCKDIPMDVCVLAYNMSFEKGRLKYLARIFPDLAPHLMNIHDNMADLAFPFQSGAYYCPQMGCSYSIKVVLPALFPDSPELNYSSLSLIKNGGDAMAAYATLHKQPQEEVPKIREALLAYCKLDTLAMVKILEKLYDMAKLTPS
ncbi:MAG: DUF2779 domain-containing protein [Defluviitaleaceae bacterium]|nr:DUF2779 domain-containing protein [Defluviitaleaceae bacterium]